MDTRQNNFIIYTKPNCPYCDRAKALLNAKGMTFEERIIDVGQPKQPDKTYVTVEQLREVVPSAKTVPQILRGNEVVGGYEDLRRLLGAS